MASSINPLYPEEGSATTQSVRDNFLAAKSEVEALQSGKEDAGTAAAAVGAHEAGFDHDLIATALQPDDDAADLGAGEAADGQVLTADGLGGAAWEAVPVPKLDDLAAPDDTTDLDASTSAHGLAPKASAPAAGNLNVLGIGNGETAFANKAIFDGLLKVAVVASLPGTPDANTLYFVTGASAVDLGAALALEIPAVTGRYRGVITGDAELTYAVPESGRAETELEVRARCLSTGTLAATYQADPAEAAGYSGSVTAGLALRTAYFLVGGADIEVSFAATLSDASATDDALTHTITGTGWYLVTVAYRAEANDTTLDWVYEQTNSSGTLYLMAIAVSAAGDTGVASLTISDAAQSTAVDLSALGIGDWAHYGRTDVGSVDGLGTALIGAVASLGALTQVADGGSDISFEGVAPATEYVVTITGEDGYTAAPGAGYLSLDAVVLADGSRSVNASRWVPQA